MLCYRERIDEGQYTEIVASLRRRHVRFRLFTQDDREG
jgi:hypothetical protein